MTASDFQKMATSPAHLAPEPGRWLMGAMMRKCYVVDWTELDVYGVFWMWVFEPPVMKLWKSPPQGGAIIPGQACSLSNNINTSFATCLPPFAQATGRTSFWSGRFGRA